MIEKLYKTFKKLSYMFTRTNSQNPDFQHLVALLDADLTIRNGDADAFYAQFNKINKIKHAIVAYSDEKPVGCGAFKKFDAQTVEIKRMFVQPDFRGQGIASTILKELETWAKAAKYKRCVLETGKANFEALALYPKMGYTIIPNYGQYEGVENSVCMEKYL
jgi:putative acetyltransferase